MTGKLKALLTALAVALLRHRSSGADRRRAAAPGAPTSDGQPARASPSPSSTTPPGHAPPTPGPAAACGVAPAPGAAPACGAPAPGLSWLTDNPDALVAWLQLKADHVAAMQTWHDTYKADLKTPEAQQALHDLWTKTWNDMKTFYEQYDERRHLDLPLRGACGAAGTRAA